MVRDNNIRIRIFKNRLLYILVCVLSGLTAIPLLAILGEVLVKGWKQLGWSFITEATPNAYKAMQAVSAGQDIPGGIANGIIGTFLMLLLAAVVAIPIGVFCGICLSEYRKNWFATIVSYLTDLLQGTPSIIIGIITYILGSGAHERIFGYCRKRSTVYHDAAAHYPFNGRNDEGSSRYIERSRTGAGRKLLACDVAGDAAFGFGKYLYWYLAGNLACGR